MPLFSRSQPSAIRRTRLHNVSDRNQRAWNGRSLTYRHAQHFQYQGNGRSHDRTAPRWADFWPATDIQHSHVAPARHRCQHRPYQAHRTYSCRISLQINTSRRHNPASRRSRASILSSSHKESRGWAPCIPQHHRQQAMPSAASRCYAAWRSTQVVEQPSYSWRNAATLDIGSSRSPTADSTCRPHEVPRKLIHMLVLFLKRAAASCNMSIRKRVSSRHCERSACNSSNAWTKVGSAAYGRPQRGCACGSADGRHP